MAVVWRRLNRMRTVLVSVQDAPKIRMPEFESLFMRLPSIDDLIHIGGIGQDATEKGMARVEHRRVGVAIGDQFLVEQNVRGLQPLGCVGSPVDVN